MRILSLALACSLLMPGCTTSSNEEPTPGRPPALTGDTRRETPSEATAKVVGPWRLALASEGPARQGLDIYIATVPSGEARLLAGIDGRDDFSPSLSPDGRWVAYRLNPYRSDESDIYLVRTRGGRPLNLTRSPGTADWSPSWSPSGEEIAFFSNEGGGLDIWVMTSNGSGRKRLTTDPALDEYPTWSPDGARLAFQSTRDGEFDIFVMASNGRGQINITRHPSRDQWASWSPDGEWIAFMSMRDGSEDIFVTHPDGGGLRNLTGTPDLQESHPAWLPDGTLTFSRHGESGPISLWAVSLDGETEIQIDTPAEPVFVYSWGPATS